MAAIDLLNLTNSTDAVPEGTGVFDVLIQAVERHIKEEYRDGRITGQDYVNVYLGSMQSVLAESVKFLMTEQQADKQADLIAEQIIEQQKRTEPGGIIDLEKQNIQEQIDLVIAQTAAQYESIQASSQDTVRKNLINSKQSIKLEKDTELVISQNSELLLNGIVDRDLKTEQKIAVTSGALDKTNETNAQVALINANEDKVISENLQNRFLAIGRLDKEMGFDITFGLDGTISTIATGTEGELDKKNELISAQTVGFKSDAKQKLLKQLIEGYAINVTTSGTITDPPNGSTGNLIDDIANDILADWSSSVVIPA